MHRWLGAAFIAWLCLCSVTALEEHEEAHIKQDAGAHKELEMLRAHLAQFKKEMADKERSFKAELAEREASLKAAEAAMAEAEAAAAAAAAEHSEAAAAVAAQAAQAQELQARIDQATSELAASRQAGDSCQSTLSAVSADLEEQKSRLRKAIQAAEESYLPPWLVRQLDAGWEWTRAQWARVASDASIQQVQAQARGYLGQAQAAAAPYLVQAQAALAQLGLQDSIRQAQVQLAAARAAAGAAFSNVETELKALIGGQLRAQPALASYDDPVVIQMLAYAVMGAPLLLLVPLLASCMGGGGGSSSSGSGGRGARSGASSKAAATNGRRAAGAAATPASKRPTRATRGAGG